MTTDYEQYIELKELLAAIKATRDMDIANAADFIRRAYELPIYRVTEQLREFEQRSPYRVRFNATWGDLGASIKKVTLCKFDTLDAALAYAQEFINSVPFTNDSLATDGEWRKSWHPEIATEYRIPGDAMPIIWVKGTPPQENDDE